MLHVCTGMLLVCARILLVSYSYATRMLLVCYSYATRMLLVCYSSVTGMLLVCYSYVLVWCFSHDPFHTTRKLLKTMELKNRL